MKEDMDSVVEKADQSENRKSLNVTSNIRKALGDPYFEQGECLIYKGDCVGLMKALDPEIVDLTVTSPPYNIGKEYEESRPLEDYLDWSEEWIREVYRITRPYGAFWLNVGYTPDSPVAKALPLPYLLWSRIPFYLIQEVVWNYGAGVAGKLFFSPRNEKCLWYVKNESQYTFHLDEVRDKNVKYPNQRKNGKLKCNPLGKNPTDVWEIAKVTSGKNRSSKERMPHPAQFPEALISRIIKASTSLGDLVCDPFLGSGTTAAVSLAHQRPFLGFEIREEYCEMAAKRVEKFVQAPELFA